MHARDGCVDAGPFAVAGEEKGQRVARVQCCVYAAAVSGMGFVGLGKCGVGGVWLDKVLRPRLGNEGLEQDMAGWNAVLGGGGREHVCGGRSMAAWWQNLAAWECSEKQSMFMISS